MTKIMTVDDSAFERRIIKDILEKAGYEAIEAESGDIGVELYITEKPDAVLMDLRMPGMSGSEALKKIMEIDPNARVIIVSIIRDQDTMDELMLVGAKDYVKKPVTEGKLIPAVKKILGG